MFNISVEKYDQVNESMGGPASTHDNVYTRLKIHNYKEVDTNMDIWKRFGYVCRQQKMVPKVAYHVCPVLLLVAFWVAWSYTGEGEVHGGNECHWSVMTCLEKQEDKESHCLLSVYTAECWCTLNTVASPFCICGNAAAVLEFCEAAFLEGI